MANTSIKSAFERMWRKTTSKIKNVEDKIDNVSFSLTKLDQYGTTTIYLTNDSSEATKSSSIEINTPTKITYGTEDLTAGTSTLETGSIYFVYE